MRNLFLALGASVLASCASLSGTSKEMLYVVEASGGA